MDLAEAERILLARGWLAAQPPALRAALLRHAVLLDYRKGDHLFRAGDPPGGPFAVVEGSFGSYLILPHAGPELSHIFRPGFWFGADPALGGNQRLVSVRAMEPSRALHIPLTAARDIAGDPDAARRLSQIGVEGLRVAIMAVADLMIRRVDRRLGAVVLRVTGALEDGVPRPTADVRLTQGELARMANASRDLVNRTLGKFEAAGWVRLGYNRIAVLEPAALAGFAHARAKKEEAPADDG